VTSAKVWALDRRVFQQVMKKTGLQRIDDNLKFLRSVPLFERLTTDHMSKIADVLEVVSRLSNPAPFFSCLVWGGGGGGYRSLLGFPLHPFSRTRPHEDFLSPYFLNLRLLSFPCCHCQEGNDKRNLLYTPYHTEKRGEYESYFSFSVWLNVPRDPPSQTGAHRSPALTQIAVTGVETRPRDLLHYIYEEGGCCWLHTHTHNQTPKLTYEKLREMEEMGRGRGKLCG
jgi:hypothetical protein